MNIAHKQENIDDLAAEAIRLGRQIAEVARELELGRDAKDTAFVARCLTRLGERQPFVDADHGGLDAVYDILAAEIADEIIDFEQRFVETQFDESGPRGEVRDVPVHSERGAGLLELQKVFCRFLETRNAVLDHVAAHRALMMLMSG